MCGALCTAGWLACSGITGRPCKVSLVTLTKFLKKKFVLAAPISIFTSSEIYLLATCCLKIESGAA